MISVVLVVFFTLSAVVTGGFIRHFLFPWIAQKIADRQWRSLHPDLDRSAWR